MKRTIEDLWNGRIAPGPNCGVGDPQIENLSLLIERHKQALERELGDQQRPVLDKYTDCIEEYTYLMSLRAFTDGFCLAGKLMTTVLAGDEN